MTDTTIPIGPSVAPVGDGAPVPPSVARGGRSIFPLDGGTEPVRFSTLVVALTGLVAPPAAGAAMAADGGPVAADVSAKQVAQAPVDEPSVEEADEPGAVDLAPLLSPLPQNAARGLDPAFLGRLRRVVDRMAAEHAIEVEVVEGLRSPERQTELYAQGRTSPGPVVTWTRNSLHLRGAAADVRLDGQPPVGERALLLSRIAQQEGLRTLYPFDSGHIQLGGADSGPDAHGEGSTRPAASVPGGRQPNGVAVPAPVARPAAPATPARPGSASDASAVEDGGGDDPFRLVAVGSQRRGSPGPPSGVGGVRPTEVPAPSGVSGRPGDELRVGDRARDAGARSVASPMADGGSDGQNVATSPLPTGVEGLPQPAGRGGAAASGSLPVAHPASAVHAALPPDAPQDVFPGLRTVRVPLSEAGEEAGALRIGLRSGQVHAEVQIADQGLAERLVRSVQELRRSLAERGLEMGTWAVRVAPGSEGVLRTPTEALSPRGSDSGAADGFTDTRDGQRSTKERAGERERNARRDGRHPEGER